MSQRLIWNFEINSTAPLQLPHDAETQKDVRWESRFFWPGDTIITLQGLDETFLEISRYQCKHRQDCYSLLMSKDYNIKVRREQLLYKPLLMKSKDVLGYGKKIKFEDQDPLTTLPGINEENIAALLIRLKKEAHHIQVEKEALIYRFEETIPKLKLELARLSIVNTVYFSVSIESRSQLLVESVAQHLLPNQISCDYVTFLKQFLTQ